MRISDWSSDVCSSDLPIFDALAEGKITLDVAKAYGSTADRDTQLAAWNVIKDSWQGDQPHTIRRYLNESAIEASSAVANLVGRSEERRVGKECVSRCRSRGSLYH